MSDTGTITEIEPEDGLGWIELANGDRVRFGGTSCKGFVPAVGMTVKVVATRPGYGGTVKATELARIADAPKEFAADPTSGAAPIPRTSLHGIQSAGVRTEDLLLSILGRADVDDRLHADLAAASFSAGIDPRSLGCRNPWFYGVASGGANAFGLYAHPMFESEPAQPWLLWDGSGRTLRVVAYDAAAFFNGLVATATQAGVDATMLTRLRGNLLKLGMPDTPGEAFGGGEKVTWLPPDEGELRSLDEYLGESDGGEMERGLLAHAFREGAESRAGEALRSLYSAWGWTLPSWSA